MKVALSLEVTDDQRRQLACRVAGKSVARLATREEVRDYVNGALGCLSHDESIGRQVDPPDELGRDVGQARRLGIHDDGDKVVADKLLAEGKSESYIRGWIAAGRQTR